MLNFKVYMFDGCLVRFRPDSDVSVTIHVGSDFHFFYFVILTCLSALVCSGTFRPY